MDHNITNIHVHEARPHNVGFAIVGGILKGSSLILLFFCGIYTGLQFVNLVFGTDILAGDLNVFNSVTNMVTLADSIGFTIFGKIMKFFTWASQGLINSYPKVIAFFDNLFNGNFVANILAKIKDILLSIF